MASIITVSISPEIEIKLRREKNKSGLINRLLSTYYSELERETRNSLEIIEDLDTKQQRLKIAMEQIEDEKKAIKEEEEEKENEKQKKQKELKEKEERILNSFEDSFLTFFQVSKEQARKLAKEYYQKRSIGTLFQFAERLGLNPKQEDTQSSIIQVGKDGELRQSKKE